MNRRKALGSVVAVGAGALIDPRGLWAGEGGKGPWLKMSVRH